MSMPETGNSRIVCSAWRSVLLSSFITAALFVSIPLIENIFSTEPDIMLRDAETAVVPEPEQQPPEKPKIEREPVKEYRLPRPELEKVQRKLLPLRIAVSLDLTPNIEAGDFSLDFARSPLEMPSTEFTFELAEVDRPPRSVYRMPPFYPFTARRRGVEGRVVLKFIVKADGSVGTIEVVEASPRGVFEQAAVEAVKQWKFNPASKDGEPVNCWIIQPIRFKLGSR